MTRLRSLSHAPSATDHGSITHVNGCAPGEDEGLLSLCDDDSSSDSQTTITSSTWDPSAGADVAEHPQSAPSVGVQTRHQAARAREQVEPCHEQLTDTTARAHVHSKNDVELPAGADTWDIDQQDAWLTHGAALDACQKEKLRMQRRAASLQRRTQGRMRSSVETGPAVFTSQTLFGRIMCGMQERAPGVLQDALTPDLREAFTPF